LLNMDMPMFLNIWMRDHTPASSGPVNGEIKISGSRENIQMRGVLQSYNGFVDNFHFNSINLNIEGSYPVLQISNSMMSREDGLAFTIDGPFVLGQADNFKKQIQNLTIAPLTGGDERQSEWIVRRIKHEQTGTTEIKYLLRQDEGMSRTRDEQPTMFGVQKSMDF
jgi:hypothetical protein